MPTKDKKTFMAALIGDLLYTDISNARKIQTPIREKKIATCPSCNKGIVDKGKFYGCSGYPDCKFTLNKDFRNKKLTKKNIEDLVSKKETIVKGIKSKNGNKYNAKIKLNDRNYIDFIEFAN